MKTHLLVRALLATVLIISASSAQAGMDLHGKRILILGDSITQNGKYVSFLSYFLQKAHPDLRYDIISIGLGSETASGNSEPDHPFPRPCIHSRLDEALEKIKPDLVFACYGMNDGIYHPLNAKRFLDYQDGIETLVQKVKQANAEAILLTPPLFDATAKKNLADADAPNFGYKTPYANYNDVLRTYGKWILLSKLPAIHKVDLNTPMLAYNQQRRADDSEFHLAKDGVHPGDLGHLLMAATILESLGLPLDGELPVVLEATLADPLFQKIDKCRQTRSKGWLDYIGYTRGKTVKTNDIESVEVAVAKMQASIDQLRKGDN